ncbi:DUF6133 family protein [Hydrogenoanaerobacterium sp.]|uniref:DUF6133 family protein n=1 Tax=Hydrogenoanaerobacterium sp. TaxID=2953763 RepID=UPI0028A15D00|nr:DUF6133 family protein [Hydrogenoanaerobacterium sp.]
MTQFIKKVKNRISPLRTKVNTACLRGRRILSDTRGEGYIDTAVKILICVVLGALLLAGLYTLFGETVLPTLTQRIKEMFNYAG